MPTINVGNPALVAEYANDYDILYERYLPSVGKGDHLVDLHSPLGTAATVAENMLLEYSEGMD